MAESTASDLLCEGPCYFNQQISLPTGNQESNDSWDYWFYPKWSIGEGSCERPLCDTGYIDSSPTHQHPQQMYFVTLNLIIAHSERRTGLSVSPGLGGRRKCWCTLWSWRPKPSHSCQTSWERQRTENIFTSLYCIRLCVARLILVWKTASADKLLLEHYSILQLQLVKLYLWLLGNLKLVWGFILPWDKVGVIWGEGDIKNPGSVSAQCASQVCMLPVKQTLLEQTNASFFPLYCFLCF